MINITSLALTIIINLANKTYIAIFLIEKVIILKKDLKFYIYFFKKRNKKLS